MWVLGWLGHQAWQQCLHLLSYLTNPKELYFNIIALAFYRFRENLSIPPSLCSSEDQTHSLMHASQWLPLSYIPSSRYCSYDFKYIFLIMIFILIRILQRSLVHLQFQGLAISQFIEFCLSLQNLKRKRPDGANNGHSSTTPADNRLLDHKDLINYRYLFTNNRVTSQLAYRMKTQ